MKSDRMVEIDHVKTGLILVMTIYHCASVSGLSLSAVICGKLYFIHSAFLLLSGILCGFHYFPVTGQVRRRLVERGCKLLLVLLIVNIVKNIFHLDRWMEQLFAAGRSWPLFLNHYVKGIDGGLFSFEVLYYIGVFLLLMSLAIGWGWRILATCGFALSLLPGYSAFFIAVGLVGGGFGMVMRHWPSGAFVAVFRGWRGWIGMAIGLMVLVQFAPFQSPFQSLRLLLLCMESFIWFFLIIFILWKFDFVFHPLAILGKYTLLNYLLQMPFLKLAMVFFPKAWDISSIFVIGGLFIGATVFMLAANALLERGFKQWSRLKSAYHFFF
jgi:hypothetical protein